MSNSRFEVFNVETGEAVFSWPFPVPEASPRRRGLAFAHAREYVLGYPQGKPLAVRLWEKGSPVPTIVFDPSSRLSAIR